MSAERQPRAKGVSYERVAILRRHLFDQLRVVEYLALPKGFAKIVFRVKAMN